MERLRIAFLTLITLAEACTILTFVVVLVAGKHSFTWYVNGFLAFQAIIATFSLLPWGLCEFVRVTVRFWRRKLSPEPPVNRDKTFPCY